MTSPAPIPTIDLSFSHRWQAEILPARPLILPPRHFVYPRHAEEVERGALEILVRPDAPLAPGAGAPGLSFETGESEQPSLDPPPSRGAEPFLATCALGFRDSVVPTGFWSTPRPEEICAVSGGYAYLIDTTHPDRFTMLPYRPVLEVLPLPAEGLLLFVGHHAILAWGPGGEAWQSEKLSDEGLTVTSTENGVLHGLGWQMLTDKETPFALDLDTGLIISPGHTPKLR